MRPLTDKVAVPQARAVASGWGLCRDGCLGVVTTAPVANGAHTALLDKRRVGLCQRLVLDALPGLLCTEGSVASAPDAAVTGSSAATTGSPAAAAAATAVQRLLHHCRSTVSSSVPCQEFSDCSSVNGRPQGV